MSSGYSANVVDTVEQKTVQEICPKEFQSLLDTIDKHTDLTLEQVAREVACLEDDGWPLVAVALNVLLDEFAVRTGLDLNLGYHDSRNDGDRYDDIDGIFWYLDFHSVWQKTKEAKKLGDKIHRQFYVTFG